MKTRLAVLFFLIGFAGLLSALPPLPDCYHTYAEIETELQQLQNQYSSIARVYTIGHSQQDNLPLYAFKISDNVELEENEPAVLFVGQIHAEEVLGVETTMSNINEILAHSQQLPYGTWINQLEMWFIPTLTPEGHNVVSSALDPSYRKNKRDNNNNGVFDYSPFVGYDIDGVDINRNFPFNWIHGDSLYTPGGLEVYDYYRGPAPASESETQGFMQFCQTQKPIYTVVWHSSRTGNLSEKVFYPMNWADVRPIPDLDLGQQIGEGVASVIITEAGAGGYEPSPQQGRKGDVNGWLYRELGNICLVVECGTANLQPDSTLMVNTVQRCTEGVKWMLNRALPFSSSAPSNSMLRGTITDAVTNLPLEAEIIVEQRHAPWFAPRKSDPVNGTYWRPVSNGVYTLRYRKQGYAEHVIPSQNVYDSWMTVNVALQPLPVVSLSGEVVSSVNGQLVPATIVLYDLENDTQDTNGEFMFTTYPGLHRIEVAAEGYYPLVDTLNISTGISHFNLHIVLTPDTVVFEEDWENGMNGWVRNGPWVLENQLSMSGYALTDSWGGNGFYTQDCNVWVRTASPIALPVSGNPLLTFDEHLYTEFDFDIVRIEVSPDTLTWQTVYTNSGQLDWWHPVYVSLNDFAGQSLYLRFRLTDQSTVADLTDPGWTIDNIKIVTGSATQIDDGTEGYIPVSVLYPNYPNPFNPETTIRFALAAKGQVSLDIYNLKGQRIRQLTDGLYNSGIHTLRWNGTDDQGSSVASGIYFYKMTAGTTTKTQKMILLK
jgi:hypothetical protein